MTISAKNEQEKTDANIKGWRIDAKDGLIPSGRSWITPSEYLYAPPWHPDAGDQDELPEHATMQPVYSMARDYASRNITRGEAEILIRHSLPKALNQNIAPTVEKAYRQKIDQVAPLLTDRDLARYCLERLQGRVRVCLEDHALLYWTGNYWDVTHGQVRIMSEVKGILEQLLRTVVNEERQAYAKWMGNMDNLRYLLEAIKLEAPKIQVSEFNRNPDLVCLVNGVFDLGAHEFRAGVMEDLMLDNPRMNVTFSGAEDIENWAELIEAIPLAKGIADDYLQMLSGYLIGTPQEHPGSAFVFSSQHPSAITVFLRTIKKIIGSYAGTMPASFLTANSTALEDLSHLADKRVLFLSDYDFTKPINLGRLQALFSGAPLTGYNRQQQRWVEFTLTGKLIIETGFDLAQIAKAIDHEDRLIPVTRVQLEYWGQDDEVIANMQHAGSEELAGILIWMLQGYYQYEQEGGEILLPHNP